MARRPGGARPGASLGQDARARTARTWGRGTGTGESPGPGRPLSGTRIRARPRKGVVYFVRPGRCPGNSVRPRPEHFPRGCVCMRAPFLGSPRAEPSPSPSLFQPPLIDRPGAGRAVGEPTSDSSPATDLLGVCPRCSGHRSPGHCMPDTVRSSPQARAGSGTSGALCAGHCSECLPDLRSSSPVLWGSPGQFAGHGLRPDPRWRPQPPK